MEKQGEVEGVHGEVDVVHGEVDVVHGEVEGVHGEKEIVDDDVEVTQGQVQELEDEFERVYTTIQDLFQKVDRATNVGAGESRISARARYIRTTNLAPRRRPSSSCDGCIFPAFCRNCGVRGEASIFCCLACSLPVPLDVERCAEIHFYVMTTGARTARRLSGSVKMVCALVAVATPQPLPKMRMHL
jgi:hypothetical protein